MSNYIKNNSKRCTQNKNPLKTSTIRIQSYNLPTFGKTVNYCSPIECNVLRLCDQNQNQFNQYVQNQQNLYQLMRLYPERFPILSSVQNIGLNEWEKRKYSNLWYRQFGTSQAYPVNDNYGGFYLVGSETPYTN